MVAKKKTKARTGRSAKSTTRKKVTKKRGRIKGRQKAVDKRELVIQKFAETGFYSKAAKAAGIDRSTLHMWMRNEPDFKAKMDEARLGALAMLEDKLMVVANKGKVSAIKFGLQQLDPKRWGKREEPVVPMLPPGHQVVTLTLVDDGRDMSEPEGEVVDMDPSELEAGNG